MKLDYYIIKYVSDNEDQEWPIGIVANDGEKAYFRALGVESRDHVDPSPLCRLTGLAESSGWAYLEWAEWFYSVVENEGAHPAGFEKVMTNLQRTGTNITVQAGPMVLVPKGIAPASIVDRLYNEIVG